MKKFDENKVPMPAITSSIKDGTEITWNGKQYQSEQEALRDRRTYIQHQKDHLELQELRRRVDELSKNNRQTSNEEKTIINKIRQKLEARLTPYKGSPHVSILNERDSAYSVLIWNYDGHKCEARSADYQLLNYIRQSIEIYLEQEKGG